MTLDPPTPPSTLDKGRCKSSLEILENRRNRLSTSAELQLVEQPEATCIFACPCVPRPGVPVAFRLPLAGVLAAQGMPANFSELFPRPVDLLWKPGVN